jgi:predicted kinase
MKAGFLMIECRVPETVARQRLQARRGVVSDARESLLEKFLASFEPMTELSPEEHIVLGETARRETVVAELRRRGIITADSPA